MYYYVRTLLADSESLKGHAGQFKTGNKDQAFEMDRAIFPLPVFLPVAVQLVNSFSLFATILPEKKQDAVAPA